MEETVRVEIFPDGTVVIEVNGIKGTACKSITEALQRRLGGDILESRDKQEMMEVENVNRNTVGRN